MFGGTPFGRQASWAPAACALHAATGAALPSRAHFAPEARMSAKTIYDFEALSIDGKPAQLSTQRGKVLLVVNTASQCGFTPQFAGLEKLWEDYRERGLVVVGFPCNQFGSQDPGSDDEIASFCSLNYGVSFPMMSKVDVNGAKAHPLWKWLTAEAPGVLGTQSIKWNFTKFLVGKDGQVIRRYAPNDPPESLRGDIERALAA
jgi:glutathione peroxidase